MHVFVAAAPGTQTWFLVDALSVDRSLAVAMVVAGGGRAAPLLDAAGQSARVVFLARGPEDVTPPEVVALGSERWRRVERDALLRDPRAELQRVCAFIGAGYDQAMLNPVEVADRAARAAAAGGELSTPIASSWTPSLGTALTQTAGSLLISTYQTNRLVCARMHDGALNTHFLLYDKPMGVAVAPGRIALGTRIEVWDMRVAADVASGPPAATDSPAPDRYLPRRRHLTGDIAVHDLAFAGDELWLVATAFSCLATLDGVHSFVPRWRPPFISALAPEDRCHLNGLAIADGRVAYVTALGATDEPGGWRAGKAQGGVLIDTRSGEIAIAGLSMPHSPRHHQGQLWLLESGTGSLCAADPQRGTVEVVAQLPGFTRGLAFIGGTAFVGLSQIRESSAFADLPLTRRLRERQCGVWMVDLATGETTGILRFDGVVQEIFDVAALPGEPFVDIALPDDAATASCYALPAVPDDVTG